MEITAQMVKQLREASGASMGDCKNALMESNGNSDEAMKLLRQRGAAMADKRAGRSAAQGVVVSTSRNDSTLAAMVDLRCETDFVARNEEFQAVALKFADFVADNCDDSVKVEDLTDKVLPSTNETVKQILDGLVAKVGEKIEIGKAVRFDGGAKNAIVDAYIHHDKKKGALIELAVDKAEALTSEALKKLAHEIAMQIIVSTPVYIKREEVPQAKLDEELEVERNRAIEEGKPEDKAAMIAKGRVEKGYVSKVVLLSQPYWRDEKQTIEQVIKASEGEIGAVVTVTRFTKLAVDEGA